MAEVEVCPSRRHRPRASRADQAPRAKVVRPAGRSTLTPGALPSYPEGGRRREDEPPPAERAIAPTQQDGEHQGEEARAVAPTASARAQAVRAPVSRLPGVQDVSSHRASPLRVALPGNGVTVTGVALIPQTSHSFGIGGLVFVFGIVFVIVLGLVLMYGRGGQSRRTAHRASRVPERNGNHGQRTVSRRRPRRP